MSEISRIRSRVAPTPIADQEPNPEELQLALRGNVDTESVGTASTGGARRRKSCACCLRVKGISVDFMDGTLLAKWSQGLWCDDGWNLHRTCYRGNVPLPALEVWLQEYANRCEWNLRFVARLALKSSVPSSHITLGGISDLVQAFLIMSRVLQVPVNEYIVVPIQMFLSDARFTSMTASASDLVCLATPTIGVYSVGVRVDISLLQSGGDLWTLPHAEDESLLRSSLLAPTAGDQASVRTVLGVEAEGSVDSPDRRSCTSIVEAASPQSKLACLFFAQKQKIMGVMRGMIADCWHTEVKESQVSPMLLKMEAFMGEVEQAGEGNLLAKLHTFLEGVRAWKTFLRLYREFRKKKFSIYKHHALVKPAVRAGSLFRDEGLEVHPSFTLVMLKCMFYGFIYDAIEQRQVPALAFILDDVVSKGLVMALKANQVNDISTAVSGADEEPQLFNSQVWLSALLRIGAASILTVAPPRKSSQR